jgi:hypothetical protein
LLSNVALGNIDFGYEILNFADLPDSNNQYYVILDSGNTENLGVAGFVKRSCSEIIIVDSEEDQDYAFDAYVKFKQIVGPTLGVSICVPEIDQALWPGATKIANPLRMAKNFNRFQQ